jgi:hypothetical protein
MAELPRLNGIIKPLEEGGVAFVGSAPADGVAGTSAPYDGALFEMEHGPYDTFAGLSSSPGRSSVHPMRSSRGRRIRRRSSPPTRKPHHPAEARSPRKRQGEVVPLRRLRGGAGSCRRSATGSGALWPDDARRDSMAGFVVPAHRFHPSQSQTARPITSSRSRPRSQGSSSVNSVTHWRHEQGMRVMSVPQNQRVGPKAS